MNTTNILILGSTGSIGGQALDIVRNNPGKFSVFGLTAHSNVDKLARQVNEFRPEYAVLADESLAGQLREKTSGSGTRLLFGSEPIAQLVSEAKVDVVLNSLVGFCGFEPTHNALKAGKKVALANKESLVVGGELLREYTENGIRKLIPVDSEHSAILQCLIGEEGNPIEKLIITASGGPFRTFTRKQMESVTIGDALNHPNWSMGSKITIDSATMMNKGLEIIEAYWLYHLPLSKIEAVVHPQSIIHSMVTFEDGSTKAQMGHPDMKVPIQYALTWPERIPLDTPRMDFSKLRELTFEPVDFERFPCLKLAIDAIDAGGFHPTVLNAANEVAVDRFLRGEIPYIGISAIVEKALENIHSSEPISVGSLKHTDQVTREFAATA